MTDQPTSNEVWEEWCRTHPEDRAGLRQHGGLYRRAVEGTTGYAFHRVRMNLRTAFKAAMRP